MGSMIRVRCSHCFEEWELRVGYGMMHGRLERVTPLFPEEAVKSLPLKKMQSMAIPWSFAYEPAHCGQCHALVSLPVLRYSKEAILTDRNSSAQSRTGLRSAPVGAERTSTGRPAPPEQSSGAGKDTILTAPCPNCGAIPALIQQKRLPGTTCPACGKEALEVTETGLWD